jgi:protein-tyrosine phosphatase
MMELRTSETSPLYVDFLPAEAHALPGRLGLTIAPGKRDHFGLWDRDLELDLVRLRDHYRVSLLVTLLEQHELEMLRIPKLLARAQALGLETEWFPFADGDVPADEPGLAALDGRILAAMRAGHTVVVHCRGGIGRSGLVAASCLMTLGRTPDEAIGVVRTARQGAIEPRQAAWLLQRKEGAP